MFLHNFLSHFTCVQSLSLPFPQLKYIIHRTEIDITLHLSGSKKWNELWSLIIISKEK